MFAVKHYHGSRFVRVHVKGLAEAIGESSVVGLSSGHVGSGLDVGVLEPPYHIGGVRDG